MRKTDALLYFGSKTKLAQAAGIRLASLYSWKVFPQPAGVALPVQEAETQEEIKTEAVADIVQSLPSFTETRADDLILPSLHVANRELRRAKGQVQKWERVCAALRELNKHRDIVRQITDSSRRVASEK